MTAEELLDEPDRAPARIAELVVADPDATTGAGSGALERRDDLTARAESYARGARAEKTWAAYERQWARFESWCQDAGEAALPAAPLTVVRFLADLAPAWRPATPADPPTTVNAGQVRERDGLRPGTLAGYLAAISVVHQTAGLDNPTRAEAVRRTMAGIRRHPGVAPPQPRAAARRDPLVALLQTLRPDEHLADARDAALLLIGWKAALRTDDLARLRMDDLHATEQGLSVFVRRSKTDQTGHGTTLGVAAPTRTGPTTRVETQDEAAGDGEGEGAGEESGLLDAGAAWVRWRNLLGAHGILEGPAWRGIDRYGRRPRAGGLHRNSIAGIITRRAAAAGLDDADRWGGHSLRRGFATEAIAAGVPERDVQRHGRWRSRASMDPYIDAARTFDATNPTHWLS